MDLSLVSETFCATPVYWFDGTGWVLADTACRMPPYDRFISDRAFGQKKRILHTPGGKYLPLNKYLRVGAPTGRVFMVESLNPDRDENGEYLNTYMVREATVEIEVLTKVETAQASGAKSATWAPERTVWGDFDRYGVIRSAELPVDYTSYTVSVPKELYFEPDCRLKIQGQLFAITENFLQLELRQLRVRGLNGEP